MILKKTAISVRTDGEMRELMEEIKLTEIKYTTKCDRLITAGHRAEAADSPETAPKLGGGLVVVDVIGGQELL